MTRPVPVEVGLVTTRLRTFFARNGLRVSVVVICLVFSAILWTGLLVQLNIERERIIESKRHENDNLARVFEEHVARTIRAAEVTLREIASEYRRYGRKFDLVHYAKDRNIYLDPYNVLSVIDANGNLALSTSPPHTPTNYRKYDNFQYHTQHETSNIYISRPRLGDTTGKWTVYLSRRMNKADGSFGGNVTVGMDPTYFSRIYAELDLGEDATVTLLKRDGIVLARVSNSGAETTTGQNVAGTPLFTKLMPAANHGSFIGASTVDGVTRINSYRALKDYPLVIVIGTSQAVALARYEQRRSVYIQTAGAMTVVILSLGVFALFQIARSEREREERRRSEDLFRILAEGSPVGIFRADAASKCVYVNGRWCDIAGIRADAALGDGWASAIHPDDRERVFGEWTAAANNRQPFLSEYRFQRPDGNVTWVVGQARAETDSQGEVLSYVGTITDITKRKRAEQQAQRLS
ncbi:MAG: PAS domain S-box protein, partial [Betaproteobacteria bacterium]